MTLLPPTMMMTGGYEQNSDTVLATLTEIRFESKFDKEEVAYPNDPLYAETAEPSSKR